MILQFLNRPNHNPRHRPHALLNLKRYAFENISLAIRRALSAFGQPA